jgi:GR25 family glycosyltransferase involved in LPS biosynthesis
MLNDYVDQVVVLSQRSRVDRRYLFDQQAQDAGLDYRYFFAIEASDPKASFNLSHKAILTEFAKSDDDAILVMEDDADLRNLEMVDDIMGQLPAYWDLLYLSANVKPYPDFAPPDRIARNLFRLWNAYTTHAIIYRKETAKLISEIYSANAMYDAWLDKHILPTMDAYICCPFLSWQRPSRSDLWDRVVDYTDTFQASENYLNSLP